MKEHVDVYFFTEQPYKWVTEELAATYDSNGLFFPNKYFDPWKAHELYNEYHEMYAYADELGFDGVMTNEHHAAYTCMKPAANLDAAVIAKITKRVKIAILGNVIAVSDPVRMAEEIAMLDCYSGGRIISGFVRGIAQENIHGGIDPSENWERFQEAHDLIIKCWTTPGPFRHEGKYWHHRFINPWVLPMQKPHPPVWFPGAGSPESVVWTAQRQHSYMAMGPKADVTLMLKQTYIDTAREVGFTPGPEHFGYLIKVLAADTDEKAQEIGRKFLWGRNRGKGTREESDPPGYQSRRAVATKTIAPGLGGGRGYLGKQMDYEELQEADLILVGNPDTVTRKLTRVIERLNPGYILIYANEGDMTYKDTMRSIELLGKEIIPTIKEIELQPYE